MVTGDEARELPGYARDLAVSADGKHIAYQTGAARNYAMVIDGIVGPIYPMIRIGQSVFTADGHTRYLARNQHGWVAVIDGKETPVGDDPIYPVVSPDGKRQALQVVVDRQAKMVVDGVDGVLYDYTSTPIFSADSRHLAYFARRGNQTLLVVDGQEGSPCEAVIAPRLYGKRPMDPTADPTPLTPLLSGGIRLFIKADHVRYLIYRDKAVYCIDETLK